MMYVLKVSIINTIVYIICICINPWDAISARGHHLPP